MNQELYVVVVEDKDGVVHLCYEVRTPFITTSVQSAQRLKERLSKDVMEEGCTYSVKKLTDI